MENAFEQTGAIAAAIRRALPTGEREQKAAQLPALNLAFIGDTVFDLYVRTLLVTQADAKVHELHLMSAKRVCAKGQACHQHMKKNMQQIEGQMVQDFTPQEQEQFARLLRRAIANMGIAPDPTYPKEEE